MFNAQLFEIKLLGFQLFAQLSWRVRKAQLLINKLYFRDFSRRKDTDKSRQN